MRGFHLLVMMVIGDSVKDTQCGFKVSTLSTHICVLGGAGGGWGGGHMGVLCPQVSLEPVVLHLSTYIQCIPIQLRTRQTQ